MVNKHTCISEERLTTLIKEIFREEFQNQEKNIMNIISGNHKIYMDEIKNIKKDVEELKDSIEHTEDVVDLKIKKVEEKIEHLKENFKNNVENKPIELEDRSRRENIRVDGLIEEEGETWDATEIKVSNLLQNKLGLTNVQIDRAHRTGRKGREYPRTIVAKLSNYKDKEKILKNRKKLKGTDIYINEDFSKETVSHRKKLWSQVKKLRAEGKFAFLQYRSIVKRERDINDHLT